MTIDPAAVDAAMARLNSLVNSLGRECGHGKVKASDAFALADAVEHYRQQLAAATARAEWSEATVTTTLTAQVVERIAKNHRRWAAYARILAKAHSDPAMVREYTEQAAEMERDAAALENQEGNDDGR